MGRKESNQTNRLLEIAVCYLIMLKDYPHSLTNADIFGQGNLYLVSEKSGKSQGILLFIICGNPDRAQSKSICRPLSIRAGTINRIIGKLVY